MNGLTAGPTALADHLQVSGPTPVIDRRRARSNIKRMVDRAAAAGVRLRPHFKTHDSVRVGRWFREAGVEAITVSNLDMARRFAADGWRDITLAMPFNPRQRDVALALAGEIDLGLLIDDPGLLDVLSGLPVRIWLEIDTGYGRSGVPWHETPALQAFRGSVHGVLTHAGQSYRARDAAEILELHALSLQRMAAARSVLGDVRVSIGDTPSCTLADTFPGVDEIRPGNFVFFDLMQLELGVCAADDIAAAMLCPVISRHPVRGELVIHGGAVHFSREVSAAGHFGVCATVGPEGFGEIRQDARLVSLSQEHGIIRTTAEVCASTVIGEMVLVFPVHSCLMSNLHDGNFRII